MKENIPHAAQVALFCGSRDAFRLSEFREDFRLLRGVYSLLASLAAPLLGVIPAMLLINWLAWGLCAWTTWRWTIDVVASELAAMLAVMLVSGGMGMTTHIGDYSPHLLAFAAYYFGAWLIFRSRTFDQRRPWTTHLRLSLYFAIACLTYNTGIMLVGVYVLSALRHNRLHNVISTAVIALSARPLWRAVLGARVSDVEAEYLGRAIGLWKELFAQGFLETVATIGGWLSEYLFFFDSPLVVVAGLACTLTLRMPTSIRWFGWIVMGIPLLASLVFTPAASARGYLVYGGTVWIYVCLAAQLAGGLRSPRRHLQWAAGAMMILIFSTHFAWSTAYLGWVLGPVKTFFLGWDEGYGYLSSPPTEILSITDREPTPILFGGAASLEDAGAVVRPDQHPLDSKQVSFGVALIAKAWFFSYFAMLAAAVPGTVGKRASWVAAVVAIYIVSCGWTAWSFRLSPAFFPVDWATPLESGQTLRYEAEVGPRFVDALQRHAGADDSLIFFLRGEPFFVPYDPDQLSVSIHIGDTPVSVAYEEAGKFIVRPAGYRRVVEELTNGRPLIVELTNRSQQTTRLSGWQRSDLGGRRCEYRARESSARRAPRVLPIIELRVVDDGGHMKLAGF